LEKDDLFFPYLDEFIEGRVVGDLIFFGSNEVFEVISSEVLNSNIGCTGRLELDVIFFHESDKRDPAFSVFFGLLFELIVDSFFLFSRSLNMPVILLRVGLFSHE
jgi:hypothetical protein